MPDPLLNNEIKNAVAKRRTFAIISHPDAGKTTLTEKLLLYSGMIQTAGMVRGRKGGKVAVSDWMALNWPWFATVRRPLRARLAVCARRGRQAMTSRKRRSARWGLGPEPDVLFFIMVVAAVSALDAACPQYPCWCLSLGVLF